MAFWDTTIYNGTDLNAIEHFSIDSVDVATPPEELLTQSNIARKDGAVLYNRRKGLRKVTLTGHTAAPDYETMHAVRSTLLRIFEQTEKLLQVPIGNDTWELTCTLEDMIVSDKGGGYSAVTITMTCSDPFAYDRDARTIVDGTTTTTASKTFELSESVGGVYNTPPIITLTFSDITDTDTKYFILTNSASASIIVTRVFSSGDVVQVDMKNRTVKANGIVVDYTGNFWELAYGDTSFDYEDNLTARTVGCKVTYKRRW